MTCSLMRMTDAEVLPTCLQAVIFIQLKHGLHKRLICARQWQQRRHLDNLPASGSLHCGIRLQGTDEVHSYSNTTHTSHSREKVRNAEEYTNQGMLVGHNTVVCRISMSRRLGDVNSPSLT